MGIITENVPLADYRDGRYLDDTSIELYGVSIAFERTRHRPYFPLGRAISNGFAQDVPVSSPVEGQFQ